MRRISTETWEQKNTLGDLQMLRNLNQITELSLLKLYQTITNSVKHLLLHMLDGVGKKQKI